MALRPSHPSAIIRSTVIGPTGRSGLSLATLHRSHHLKASLRRERAVGGWPHTWRPCRRGPPGRSILSACEAKLIAETLCASSQLPILRHRCFLSKEADFCIFQSNACSHVSGHGVPFPSSVTVEAEEVQRRAPVAPSLRESGHDERKFCGLRPSSPPLRVPLAQHALGAAAGSQQQRQCSPGGD